jgi:AcrR family transcriptional regulator
MSQIAEETGIGRATLYKYFPDVEAILTAWHADQITAHLGQLTELLEHTEGAAARLETLLAAYAGICHGRARHDAELNAVLHRGAHLADAQRQLTTLFRDLIGDAANAGIVRTDVSSEELATYCVHALGAASTLASARSVRRLVEVTLAGLRPVSTH